MRGQWVGGEPDRFLKNHPMKGNLHLVAGGLGGRGEDKIVGFQKQ